jgi:hypothetical protein
VILKTSAALAPGEDRTRITGIINAMESALAVPASSRAPIDLGTGGVMRSLMAKFTPIAARVTNWRRR